LRFTVSRTCAADSCRRQIAAASKRLLKAYLEQDWSISVKAAGQPARPWPRRLSENDRNAAGAVAQSQVANARLDMNS
jgi:hypothetical protein